MNDSIRYRYKHSNDDKVVFFNILWAVVKNNARFFTSKIK